MDVGDFEPQIGTPFALGDGHLTLAEVTKHGGAGGGPRPEPFSLVFEAAEGSVGLEQRIHALRHPVLGELELFLVPIGPGRYEAVFN